MECIITQQKGTTTQTFTMKLAKETVLKSCNIQGQSQMDRIEGWSYWTPNEDDLIDKQGQPSDTAFFFGCSSSYRGVSKGP